MEDLARIAFVLFVAGASCLVAGVVLAIFTYRTGRLRVACAIVGAVNVALGAWTFSMTAPRIAMYSVSFFVIGAACGFAASSNAKTKGSRSATRRR